MNAFASRNGSSLSVITRMALAMLAVSGFAVQPSMTTSVEAASPGNSDRSTSVADGHPTIGTITPSSVKLEGGEELVIDGQNFSGVTRLILGDAEVTDFTVESPTRIRCHVPTQQAPGGRTLSVMAPDGLAQSLVVVHSKRLAELSSGEITTIAGGVPFIGDGGPALTASVDRPYGVAMDPQGNVVFVDTYHDRVRRIDKTTGVITTVAGTGLRGYNGDGRAALSAHLWQPYGLALDSAGNIFIADTINSRIRRVDQSTGQITTVAGTGDFDYFGDGGPATEAAMQEPVGVTVDASGNLFIADSKNNRIRRVDAASGVITTVAGNGDAEFNGDNQAATTAALNGPRAVIVDVSGNLLIADTENQRVRSVDAATGRITTVAGDGKDGFKGDGKAATRARLSGPGSIVRDSDGNVYISDTNNGRIRRVDGGTGIITTVAGAAGNLYEASGLVIDSAGALVLATGSGNRIVRTDATSGMPETLAGTGTFGYGGDGMLATGTEINRSLGVAVDPNGNTFIADTFNNRVRRVDIATGLITTVAGTGEAGFSGDGGPAVEAQLNSPNAVAVEADGNVLITDTNNGCIRRIELSSGTISTVVSMRDIEDAGKMPGLTLESDHSILFSTSSPENQVFRISPGSTQPTLVAGKGPAGFKGDGKLASKAKLANPVDMAVDSKGNIYISDNGNNRVRVIDKVTGIISTFAGTGEFGDNGEDIPATEAQLDGPSGIVVDAADDVLFSDSFNRRVRKIDANTHLITAVAGTGERGYSGDNGPATEANLGAPFGLAYDADGNLYIADTTNNAIRVVKAGDASITATTVHLSYPKGVAVDQSGNILVADTGNGVVRRADPDGHLTTIARGVRPTGVAVDAAGNIVFADLATQDLVRYDAFTGQLSVVVGLLPAANVGYGVAVDANGYAYVGLDVACKVIRVSLAGGTIETIAGSGHSGWRYIDRRRPATEAWMGQPVGLAVDTSGDIYIAERGTDKVRRLDVRSSRLIDVAGEGATDSVDGDGIPARTAQLFTPTGVALDAQGNVYIAEWGGHRIRRVSRSTGLISTVAGTGTRGYNGDNIPAKNAQLDAPFALAVDASGNIFIADSGNNRIRRVDAVTHIITTVVGKGHS